MRNLDFIFIGLALILVLVIGTFKECSRAPVSPEVEKVAQEKERRDSIILRVDTVEKIQIKYVTKYKTIRHDSLIPCEEKLLVCDTVIRADSALISELKQVIKVDSSLIVNQDKIIDTKNLEIKGLKKQVRRQKLRTIIIGVLAGALVIGVTR